MLAADDVASVIIARNGPWLDAMRLQKLLYYVQAWHLAITDEPLFSESIKAWRDGPVIPQVRIARTEQSTRRAATQKTDGIELDELASDLIDLVSAVYGSMSGDELSALTHVEEPWRAARGELPEGAHGQGVIEPQLMAEFYRTQRRLGGRTAADLAAGGLHVRNRQAVGAIDVDEILSSLGSEFDDPGEDTWGGANLDLGDRYDDGGIETHPRRSYAGA